MKKKVTNAVVNRPTETITGLGIAPVVYGFLTRAGMAPIPTALIALGLGCVPAAITRVVAAIRG